MTSPLPQGRSRIRELLGDFDLAPRKALGQHFLADPNVIDKIVRLAGVGPDSSIVEIGGGTGALTSALAATGATVVVYEIDDGLADVLDTVVGRLPNVEIRRQDAAGIDWGTALDGDGWTMVSNLPYNVGTGIVLDALRFAPGIGRFVVMVQTEVAHRLLARPGTKQYGLPSVVVALHSTGTAAFTVRPELFYPRPRVGSTVVALDRIDAPAHAEGAIELATVAFGQRRKMVRRSLAGALADPVHTLRGAGIDPTARAGDLAPADYVGLAEAVAS